MNSPLVDVTILSPHCDKGRKHKIDTITIHCMAGDLSVESCGRWFQNPRSQCSSNYGIDSNGRIGLYVDENDRSWCSSNADNDHRAVTIEVASGIKHPYPVTDKAYNSIIALVADICKRNGIKELKWQADKSLIGQVDKQNMTVHRWFANKPCPGQYLYNRHFDIMHRVNAILNPKQEIPAWKLEGLERLAERGIITDKEYWLERIDEPMSAWGALNIIARIEGLK